MRARRFWAAVPGMALLAATSVVGLSYLGNDEVKASEIDGRYLAQFPEPSLEGMAEGTWQKDFEAFMQDRLPYRQELLELHAAVAADGMQQREIKDVWRDKATNQLIEKPLMVYQDTDRLVRATYRMGAVARQAKVPIVFGYVPRKQEALAKQLPGHWSLAPTFEAKTKLLAAYRANGTTLDLNAVVGGRPDYWFRTDHHWNNAGARKATDAILASLRRSGMPVGPAVGGVRLQSNYPDFIGSIGRKVTRGAIPKVDRITVPVSTAAMSRCAGANLAYMVCGLPVYDQKTARNAEPYTNRYAVYLGGDRGATIIRGPGKGTLLMTKDSFGLPIVTMLAPHFKTIIAIDERHYTGSKLSKVIAKYKPNGVLMLHSATVMHGTNFKDGLWG